MNEGTPIVNTDATEVDSSYEICQRSGFRVKAGTLIQEWTGLWVKPEFFEPRNMQDFVRSKAERLTGAQRPESTVMVDDLYPNGVTSDDL